MATESTEQREVHRRVSKKYVPAWCAANARPVDPSTFDPDWSFLTAGLAEWFLAALDQQVVKIRHGWPTLPASARHAHLFQGDRGIATLNREGFVEVAAAGMLAIRYGWSPERLRFQSGERGVAGLPESRRWALDLLAYADDNQTKVAIAAEAKWRPGDPLRLASALRACGKRGNHREDACSQPKTDHRKYVGLLEHRPRILWIVGPESFAGSPDLVFRVGVKPAWFGLQTLGLTSLRLQPSADLQREQPGLGQCSAVHPERTRQNDKVSHVVVEPSHGIDAEGFADSLRQMYSAWGGQVDGEQGIHRLVQRSPLDAKQRRHTSFAIVSVNGESSDEHVRTYITFPYRLVKDHRTGRETDDVAGVLAGDLSLVRGND